MIRVYISFLLSLYIGILSAQQQLPDNDFELWTPYTSGTGAVTYYEPSSGWWGSLNKLSFILSGNPISLTPTSDCHSGISAARRETKQVGTSLIPGLLFAGYFDANAPESGFIIRGRPFTSMPEKTSA